MRFTTVEFLKLIKQTTLFFQEGKSDKVYEVDLCEVSGNQYVVNFRYGRRGAALREGSKTTAPVDSAKANAIFDELVESKVKKGYSETQPVQDSNEEPSISPTPVSAGTLSPREQSILARLQEGLESEREWPLSRAVWRAGELRIDGAEAYILPLINRDDKMLDYCIAWALGRCGSEQSISALRRLSANSETDAMVRRMANLAIVDLLEGEELKAEVNKLIEFLPPALIEPVKNNAVEEFSEKLDEILSEDTVAAYSVLEHLYLINTPMVRTKLIELLKTVPMMGLYFHRARHIFKAAEMRCDGEMFGILGKRFSNFSEMRGVRELTRKYMARRSWRSMRRLGEIGIDEYVKLASGFLLAVTDEDAGEPRQESRYVYESSGYQLITLNYDQFHSLFTFNNILYLNSLRYEVHNFNYTCKPPYEPGKEAPSVREEAFPEIWDKHPHLLLELLKKKLLRASPPICCQSPW